MIKVLQLLSIVFFQFADIIDCEQTSGELAMTKGSCLCGRVVYEITGELTGLYFCHCSRCQKRTGSAFQSSAQCQKIDFRWVEGEELICATEHHTFCSQCGSQVPVALSENVYWIPVGSLEDIDLQFQSHIFVESKARWYEITDGLVQYAQGPGGRTVSPS